MGQLRLEKIEQLSDEEVERLLEQRMADIGQVSIKFTERLPE